MLLSDPHILNHLPKDQEAPSFIDVLLTLWLHKMMVILWVIAGTAAGVVLALALPRSYAVTTIIQLGSYQQGATSAIETPESVIAKVTNAYLPVIERAHAQTSGQPLFTLGLDLKNPKGTTLLLMTSKAMAERENEHITLHTRVAERVLDDHRREFQLLRTNLGLELDQARRALAAVKDQAGTLVLRRTLLEEKRTLVNRQMAEIEGELRRIVANRDTAGKNVSGQDQVLTLMMLDLQLAREREKRDDLQRQQLLGLVEEADRLARDEAELQRTQQSHEGNIAAIQARIAHVAETKLIGDTQHSLKPTGINRAVIVALGVFSGLGLGISIVVLLGALADRRRRIAQA